MSHPQYGRTWWGAQWLQALTQIDHDNRLPRGRTYANRGAVRDLAVVDSKVAAHVQGSRLRPYDVEIAVPQVDGPQAGRLMDRLAEDQGLVARLLNRELDPAVLQMAQQLKIAVFPARWSDLKMHCSCPDWAVPCKHLAAVIYLLSQQIDADPFLVFSLRGIDLPKLLQQRGVQLDGAGATALPSVAQALFGAAPAAAEPGVAAGERCDAGTLSQLDLSTIPDLRQTLWRVLPANPVFHRGGDLAACRPAWCSAGKVASPSRSRRCSRPGCCSRCCWTTPCSCRPKRPKHGPRRWTASCRNCSSAAAGAASTALARPPGRAASRPGCRGCTWCGSRWRLCCSLPSRTLAPASRCRSPWPTKRGHCTSPRHWPR